MDRWPKKADFAPFIVQSDVQQTIAIATASNVCFLGHGKQSISHRDGPTTSYREEVISLREQIFVSFSGNITRRRVIVERETVERLLSLLETCLEQLYLYRPGSFQLQLCLGMQRVSQPNNPIHLVEQKFATECREQFDILYETMIRSGISRTMAAITSTERKKHSAKYTALFDKKHSWNSHPWTAKTK